MGLFDAKTKSQPENPYLGLRRQILTIDPATLRLAATPEHPQVVAGLMEIGMQGGSATLVVIADGTTSMYFSSGGGIIGGGFHEPVKRMAMAILAAHVGEMAPDDPDHQVPASGIVHLRARTFGGTCLLAAAPNAEFAEKRHPLWDTFYAAHAVITVLRQLPAVKNGYNT